MRVKSSFFEIPNETSFNLFYKFVVFSTNFAIIFKAQTMKIINQTKH